MEQIKCRKNCGACCIYPSISSPLPGMPNGKPAGVKCIHLGLEMECKIFNHPDRPAVCSNFTAEKEFCGNLAADAHRILADLADVSISRNFNE